MVSRKIQFVLLAACCWLPISESALTAATQYTMDQRDSCLAAGSLDIPRGQITTVQAPSKDAASSTQILSCRLQFSPQTLGDTLRMRLDTASNFEDCDVSLELQMDNSGMDKVIRGCKSGSAAIPDFTAVNGKASIWLSRKSYDDTSYWFQVTISAERSEMQGGSDTASSGDVGKIVGIAAGIIAFLVIAIIICICCYRKQRRRKSQMGNDMIDNSLSPNAVHGYENNLAKITYDNSFQQSPVDKNTLGKSALERFGDNSWHKEKSLLEKNQVNGSKLKESHDDHNFVRKELQIDETGRGISKRKVHDEDQKISSMPGSPKFKKSLNDDKRNAEHGKRISDHSSFTDLSSVASSRELVRNQKLPVPKAGAKLSHSQRQEEKFNDSFQSQPSSASKEESEDRHIKTHKNIGSDVRDASHLKSERKTGEQNKHNSHDEYDTENKRKEKRLKALKKLHNYSEEDSDSERIEKSQNNKKSPTSKQDSRSHRLQNSGGHEGRFKKSASGRKPKSKVPKMTRSKSTGNALDDVDSDFPKARSKSSNSVRSLNLADDDDDDCDVDSNYTSFKRSGSKTSLYASRSSLYGRRRKNSIGETVSMSSYMHDDLDSRVGDFDYSQLSYKEKERLFKSTGDLNVNSVVIFRECTTQTGAKEEVKIYGRKPLPKTKHRNCINRGTQTTRERRDSVASDRSGRSVRSNQRLKSRSRSKESLSKSRHSRSRDFSDDDISERSDHHKRRGHQHRDDSDSEYEKYSSHSKSSRVDGRQRKRLQTKSRERSDHSKHRDKDHSDSENDQSHYSVKSFRTKIDNGESRKQSQNKSDLRRDHDDYYQPKQKSNLNFDPKSSVTTDSSYDSDEKLSVASNLAAAPAHHFTPHMPQFIPAGYPVIVQQSNGAFVPTGQSGVPVMFPVNSLSESALPPKSSIPVNPNVSKWDQLVNITEGMKKRRHQMGESLESESVLSSTWSQPQVYYPTKPYIKTQGIPGSSYREPHDASSDYNSRNYSTADSNV